MNASAGGEVFLIRVRSREFAVEKALLFCFWLLLAANCCFFCDLLPVAYMECVLKNPSESDSDAVNSFLHNVMLRKSESDPIFEMFIREADCSLDKTSCLAYHYRHGQ